MKHPKQNDKQPIIAKLNELYVQTRRKYLVQFPAGHYSTFNSDRHSNVRKFNDYMLKKHLDGDLTYGIFNGHLFNKFISFDVDFADQAAARWATLKLIDTLVREFNISRDHINASLSGNKGYHVDLFFKTQVAATDARAFFDRVIKEVGDLPGGQIEYRPSWTQGVKLPLGVHQKTGKRCWFADNYTLEPIKSLDYILGIEPMDAAVIEVAEIGLEDDQAAEFERIETETDITANVVDQSAALQKVRRILEAGRLLESNTRHVTTFTLACFYHSQGFEQAEAVEAIMDILHATPRDYFSEGSTPEFWRKEAERLVKYAFERGYTLGNADKPVTIYKSEILAVLSVGTYRQKQLAYAMLVTSKRYGSVFYLTMNSAMKMLGTKSKPTVNAAIKKLVERKFIEYVRKRQVDVARSRETGVVRFRPNKYRLLLDEPAADEPSIKITGDKPLNEAVYALCDIDEVKRYVGRKEFSNRWMT